MAGRCESSSEASCFLNGREFLDHMSSCQFLNKG